VNAKKHATFIFLQSVEVMAGLNLKKEKNNSKGDRQRDRPRNRKRKGERRREI
jgi:hypothetical protein